MVSLLDPGLRPIASEKPQIWGACLMCAKLTGCTELNLNEFLARYKMELSGNTPPYKHDKKTMNVPIPSRIVNSSHHQAVAREKGVRAFCTGFVVQLLAEDYDADINHELDAIRTHRSRVNLLTTITPIGGYYLH